MCWRTSEVHFSGSECQTSSFHRPSISLKLEIFCGFECLFFSKLVFHSCLLFLMLSLSLPVPPALFFFIPLFGRLFPAVSMALPRHMFCGGPDYSPAVVLTLARTSSSSINAHTSTHTRTHTQACWALKFHQLCQRLPWHDFTQQPFFASNKMPLSPEKRTGAEREEKEGGGKKE